MTIQDIIDGKETNCPNDWEMIKAEFDKLRIDSDYAFSHYLGSKHKAQRDRYYALRDKRKAFLLTDVGYIINRGY